MDYKELFIRHTDGTCEPQRRITLKDSAGEVTLWPGQRFSPDRKLLGISLREILGKLAETLQAETSEAGFDRDRM